MPQLHPNFRDTDPIVEKPNFWDISDLPLATLRVRAGGSVCLGTNQGVHVMISSLAANQKVRNIIKANDHCLVMPFKSRNVENI